MTYTILTSVEGPGDLARQVNDLLSIGYELYGPLTVRAAPCRSGAPADRVGLKTVWAQAMTYQACEERGTG
ncbi:MAG: hypothetical protein AABN33_18205 [Acidobacteriota bacterium]